MATLVAIKASVKARLGITGSTFDTMIDEAVAASPMRLYPRASLEVASQEKTLTTVDDYGEVTIDLSALTTPVVAARRVEAFDGYTWRPITDTLHHGVNLRLRGLSQGQDTKIRIFGINPYATADLVPNHLLQAVYWYSMSEFYDFLAGSKSDYNIYMQTTGARAVDNARDESEYFDSKANNYLDEQART